LKKRPTIILACDPGSKDYGIALLSADKDSGKIEPIKVGKLPQKHTVTTLEELKEQFDSYRKGLDKFCGKHKPDLVIIERFIARGIKGSLGERISYMLALTIDKYEDAGIPVMAVLASSWKNSANTRLSMPLKDLYKRVSHDGVESHELDAVLMGHYLWSKHSGCELFSGLKSMKHLTRLVQKIRDAK